MGYAQPVKSPKGNYYLARYLDGTLTPAGKPSYGTVKDKLRKNIRYTGKRAAEKAAADKEADARAGRLKEAGEADAPPPPPPVITFAAWADEWYGKQRLKPRTMGNYRTALDLAAARFGTYPMTDEGFPASQIDAWEDEMRAAGYEPDTVRTYRGVLHTCLRDAVPKLLSANPATKPANRGQRGIARANAASKRKVITTVLGGLLVAERMAILAGRDDEFVMVFLLQHAGLRFGEMIGLERQYARPGTVRVEWQLEELDDGQIVRDIPKDGSRGDVVTAPYLDGILAEFQRSAPGERCPCHGFTYMFRGLGAPRGASRGRVTIADVAAEAGVSAGTASDALGRGRRVSGEKRKLVEAAAARLGWARGAAPAAPAWHWRRSGFDELFAMAASGRYPDRARRGRLAGGPVPLAGEWPGTRVQGSNPLARANLSWLPVADELEPHGMRHSYRTWMEERRVHRVLAEAQMRHEQKGIEVYRHVTDEMTAELRGLAQASWEEALGLRAEMSARSPVLFLDRLLRDVAAGGKRDVSASDPQEPLVVVPFAGRRKAAG